MRRYLAYTFSVACLMLVVLSVVLWVRSYWSADGITYNLGASWACVGVFTQPGLLAYVDSSDLASGTTVNPAERGWRVGSRPHGALITSSRPMTSRLFPMKLIVDRSPTVSPIRREMIWTVVAPFWLLVLLFLFGCAPGIWVCRRRLKLRRAGCCPTCGYDLRASPARCPECGTVRRDSSVGEEQRPARSPDATPEGRGSGT